MEETGVGKQARRLVRGRKAWKAPVVRGGGGEKRGGREWHPCWFCAQGKCPASPTIVLALATQLTLLTENNNAEFYSETFLATSPNM